MTEDQAPPMSRPRVAAGALFFDERGRVLLVKPTYKDGWDIPGGYVEPGETPTEACAREVREELGLDCEPGSPLVVDWAPSETEGDKILFVFDGGALGDSLLDDVRLCAEEIETAGFHATDDFDVLMPARLARRLKAAVVAREAGHFSYLEHGSSTFSQDLGQRRSPSRDNGGIPRERDG
jgi:8-oxo-dGTP diphosphatase